MFLLEICDELFTHAKIFKIMICISLLYTSDPLSLINGIFIFNLRKKTMSVRFALVEYNKISNRLCLGYMILHSVKNFPGVLGNFNNIQDYDHYL